ncbi:MAG TPA: hypothetical protein VN963_07740, partial [bacterium]|nr:hypothetical protein [bacterium]
MTEPSFTGEMNQIDRHPSRGFFGWNGLWALAVLIIIVTAWVWIKRGGSENSGQTLRVSGWGDLEEAKIIQTVADDFEKTHPG